MNHKTRDCFLVLKTRVVLTCLGLLGVSTCFISLVQGQQAATQGYMISVSTDWVNGESGCRPLRVTLETDPPTPVLNDEHFTAVLEYTNYSNIQKIVSAPLIVPAGASSGYVDLYMDQRSYFNPDLIIERGEGDGIFQRDRDLFYESLTTNTTGREGWPNLLLVSGKFIGRSESQWKFAGGRTVSSGSTQLTAGTGLPSLGNLEAALSPPSQAIQPANSALAAISLSDRLYGCRPVDLPDAWIGLSGVHQMLISITDLRSICLQNESKRDTLQRWVSAGGRLIVFDAGPAFEQADQILPLLCGRKLKENSEPLKQKWRESPEEVLKLNQTISDANNPNYYDPEIWISYYDAEFDKTAKWNEYESAGNSDSASKFLMSDFLNGRIVAVNDDMQTWTRQDWGGLYNALAVDGSTLEDRIGQSNSEYAIPGFRVPGLGDPPVVAFQILIGLFVLIAGPVMFIVLQRTGRMQLLFVLVPLLSLAACFGLLGYAVAVDGFDSWGIVQSVTHLDQRTDAAVTHARCAYYSGRQPEPYTFDTDTVVMMPVGDESAEVFMHQEPEKITMSGGNIRPRSPHQVVTVRSYELQRKLIWLVPRDDSQEDVSPDNEPVKVQVRNRLGARVVYAVANIDAKLYAVENLPVDGQATCNLINPGDANIKLSNLAFQVFPDDQQISMNRPDLGEESSIINTLQKHSGSTLLDQPHTYIAVLEEFPAAEAQIEPVNYKSQLHVVIGKW